MAVAYESVSSVLGSGATSVDLTVPTGLAENDIDLITGAFSPTSTTDYSTPSTFTRYLTSAPVTGEIGNFIGDRLAPSSPATVTLAHNQSRNTRACRIRISGTDTTTPKDQISASLASGSGAENPGFTATVPALTTTVANTLVIGIIGWANVGGSGMTSFTLPGSGWNTIYADKTGSGSGESAITVSYKAVASAGTTGSYAVNYFRAGALTTYWRGAMIAYQPTIVGGSVPLIVNVTIF